MGITCNLCGGNNVSDWFEINSTRFYASEKRTREVYTIVRCSDCELVFVKEIPTAAELSDIYSEGYYKGRDQTGYGDYEEKLEKPSYMRMMFRRLQVLLERPGKLAMLEYAVRRRTFKGENKSKDMRLINKCVGTRGRLLDVGCAMGSFLASAKADGWDVEGVEISNYGSQHARETLSVNVFTGSLREAIKAGQIQAGSFDVVTLWDALEHLTDPASVFDDVNYALKDSGWFFFSTVNIDSLLARREGKGWHFFRPPKHLYYYSEKTLKQYLNKYGFTVAMDDDFRKDLVVIGARKARSSSKSRET
jgi:2-polyprenyl-3-methyl-5-hydroxy-6-metoxy-1,4-benzoquinol methylase